MSTSCRDWIDREVQKSSGQTIPAPSRKACDDLTASVKQALKHLQVPPEQSQQIHRRLCSFVALAESSVRSETHSTAWVDAGAGLCESLLAWVSFQAFCNHWPSAAGFLRRSRLRVSSLEESSWDLDSGVDSPELWRDLVLLAQSTLRAELDEAFFPPQHSLGAPQHSFGALAAHLRRAGARGGFIRLEDRETAARELAELWRLGEAGVREQVAAAVRHVVSAWRPGEGVRECRRAVMAVLTAEREDIARNIGEQHAEHLFGELFYLSLDTELSQQDHATAAHVLATTTRDLERLCLRAQWAPSGLCLKRSCNIELQALHDQLLAGGFSALHEAVVDAADGISAATVKECCVWQTRAQLALHRGQELVAAASTLDLELATPRSRAGEEVGWSPGQEGNFDGYGGARLYESTELGTIQRQVSQQCKWFASWRAPSPAESSIDSVARSEANGVRLVVLPSTEERREHIAASSVVVPLAGLAALGELEQGAVSSLAQGNVLQLTVAARAGLPWGREQNTQEIEAAEAPRGALVMTARAVRKTANFAGAAAKVITAPSALLFEVMSIATGQYYMHEINNKLQKIEQSLSRQEIRQTCAALGKLKACTLLTEELKQEFGVLTQIPPDWIVRCSHVLRDATHGLCVAEMSVGAFLARVEAFLSAPKPKLRLQHLRSIHAELPAVQQDFVCLLGYSKVLLQLRELQGLADLRAGSERTALSAMRVDEALLGLSQRLALFGRLEEMVSAAEDGVAELSWLQKHVMNRSAGHYARQVASDVNELQRSVNGSGQRSDLSYLLALSENGERVHVQAIPQNATLHLNWQAGDR